MNPDAQIHHESTANWLRRLVNLDAPASVLDSVRAILEAEQTVGLASFIWKEPEPPNPMSNLFPLNHFGRYVLNRERLVVSILDKIEFQKKFGTSPSVYVSGCKGSGKTCVLNLLARSLKKDGYNVYFFESVDRIPRLASEWFESLLKERSKKVAVVIDEVATHPNHALFVTLLKANNPNLVTIGAAVPPFEPTGLSGVFFSKVGMNDLVLRKDEQDFTDFINYCAELGVTSRKVTETICYYVLKQCGGHPFPTLRLIEHFLTANEDFLKTAEQRKASTKAVTSLENFCRYFCSPAFSNSAFYKVVKTRCFSELQSPSLSAITRRVLGGKGIDGDVISLTRLGWWDAATADFLSPMVANIILASVDQRHSKEDEPKLYLNDRKSWKENAELVIVEGLSAMDDSDFSCLNGETRAENGLTFNWGCRVKLKVPNAHLQLQVRGTKGLVDFYLNGIADCAIEVMLNGTKTNKALSE